MLTRRHLTQITALSLAASAVPTVLARAQPARSTARILVGFPPGGSVDIVARMLAEHIKGYASAVIVDNRPGAGGRIALEALKAAPADGAAMALTPGDQLTLFPHIYKSLGYDPLSDFVPVGSVCTVQFLLTIGSKVPPGIATLDAFLAWCRANPKQASYGTPGAGTRQHLIGELLARAAGVELLHVPYKGAASATQDVLGGHTAAMISTITPALPNIAAGTLRALTTTASRRSAALPSVPTFKEAGFPALEAVEWFGLFLPKGAPAEIVGALNATSRQAFEATPVRDTLAKQAVEVMVSSPAELAAMVKSDHASWAAAVKAIGFKPLD